MNNEKIFKIIKFIFIAIAVIGILWWMENNDDGDNTKYEFDISEIEKFQEERNIWLDYYEYTDGGCIDNGDERIKCYKNTFDIDHYLNDLYEYFKYGY